MLWGISTLILRKLFWKLRALFTTHLSSLDSLRWVESDAFNSNFIRFLSLKIIFIWLIATYATTKMAGLALIVRLIFIYITTLWMREVAVLSVAFSAVIAKSLTLITILLLNFLWLTRFDRSLTFSWFILNLFFRLRLKPRLVTIDLLRCLAELLSWLYYNGSILDVICNILLLKIHIFLGLIDLILVTWLQFRFLMPCLMR